MGVKSALAILCLGLLVVGCTGKSDVEPVQQGGTKTLNTPPPQGTVAVFSGTSVTMEQLERPLKDAYGLNVLLNLVQLEMAKQAADRNHVTVSEDDVKNEMSLTLDALVKSSDDKRLAQVDMADAKGQKDIADRLRKEIDADKQSLLDQFLKQKSLSRPEFDIVLRTNAYLRKIVEPTLKSGITDKKLEDAFRFQYGEKVLVRHIQCANWEEIGKAKKMLNAGQDFADVARAVSRNPVTGPMGGELPPFSRQAPGFTQEFKDEAFALKEGEVSDVVIAMGAYHLIKLEKRIEPIAVKFDDVKESLRVQLHDAILTNNMTQLRNELARDAVKTLKIYDPTLKEQFEKRINASAATVKGRDDTLSKLTEERNAAEKAITTQPTTAPAPATKPAPVTSTAPAAK